MTPVGPSGVQRSVDRVRQLTAADLGLANPADAAPAPAPDDERLDDLGIGDDDPLLATTLDLLDTYDGIIFAGPPGTSKSWYASNIALKLTKGNPHLVRFVQFHPSYQYEDFVEGYVPTGTGGFELRPKHLLELAELAEDHPGEWVVLVIDELSRGDPGRIFGEALTYVEKSKRELKFHLSSGTELSLPTNLVFLATMNPLDRGVDEVDAAFERRFAKIAMEPDAALLEQFLVSAGMGSALRERVQTFFRAANSRSIDNPYAAVGHTFFLDVGDESGLRRLWEHQLRFLFAKAYQLEPEGLAEVRRAWDRIFVPAPTGAPAPSDASEVKPADNVGVEATPIVETPPPESPATSA